MDNKFYAYYDSIFKDKDYQEEIGRVIAIYRKYAKTQPRSAIDIGCGTGGHSVALAKKGVRTLALDIDKQILKIALAKSQDLTDLPVNFKYADISKYRPQEEYDLAISLFNVVNYLPTLKELTGFLQGVNRSQKPKGLYIFDCWNGVAAIIDPPRIKTTRVRLANGTEVMTEIVPENDRLFQHTELNYEIRIKRGADKQIVRYTMQQYLWTPKELKEILAIANYEVLQITTWTNWHRPATEEDWKILFVCRKK